MSGAFAAGGRFITFEGIDGAGKSTHLADVAARLRAQADSTGGEVVCTREPGGSALAERLRGLMLDQPMDALTEALVVFAARRDHTQTVIRPALARGAVVLCDRYTDATFAYQGAGRGFDPQVLGLLAGWVQQGLEPDLTLWFDLPAEVAAARRGAVRTADRFEREDSTFFERVAAGYRARAAAAPRRIVRIDAEATRPEVAARVAAVFESRGWW